jgi:hypothetical protein
MPLFRALRVKWQVLNLWYKLVENRYQFRTPDLKKVVKECSRRQLMFGTLGFDGTF